MQSGNPFCGDSATANLKPIPVIQMEVHSAEIETTTRQGRNGESASLFSQFDLTDWRSFRGRSSSWGTVCCCGAAQT